MADPTPTRTDEQGQKVPGSGVKTQWVVSNLKDDRVAIWEPDTAHPGGEAFVAGKVPAEVAMTAEMNLKLRNEEIRLATPEEITKRKAQLAQMEQPSGKGVWD
jgi:hypothetical protein